MVSSLSPLPRIVTLLTDFGLEDAYVGVMKGVLLQRAPDARIVDLSHGVQPQAIDEAAFLLEGAWRYFPPGSVHLMVVDPGVGTPRRRVALKSEGHFFVGPDNGVLSAALPALTRGPRSPGSPYTAREVKLPSSVEAVAIEATDVIAARVSATFEGRDVFAPAAGYLAAGGELSALGPPLAYLSALPCFRAPAIADELDGVVVHVDHYGNLITDVRAEDLSARPVVAVAGRQLPFVRTYADATGLVALVGSSGLLEVAMANGSAARELGLGRGSRVSVLP